LPTDTLVQLTAALADRYRVEYELGRGGMATVYLAQDLKHDRPVALKVLHPEIAASLGIERFIREIRLTARLQHPHILPVFDSGAIDGRPWYSMPYIRGESLRQRLRREIQLPIGTAVEITRQVAHALAHAHGEGAVHRDIKPENILLNDGQALVADFGVARAVNATDKERLTDSGLAIGTPAYMSPEQGSGGVVDARTDVYALGCVLYEMLTGEPPFSGPTAQAIIAKRLAYAPPSARLVRPTVSEPLDHAIRQAMATIPADRYATAEQFIHALADVTVTAPPITTPVPSAGAAATTSLRRPRIGAGLLLVFAFVAVAAGGYFTLREMGVASSPTLLSSGILRQRDPIIIAEFTAHGSDSTISSAITDAFRADFAQSSVVTTLSQPQVAEALERMRQPATARLDPVLAREVAIRQGAKVLLTGEISTLGKAYLITAQLVSPQSGDVLAAERETAEDDASIIAAVDRLSSRLRRRIGESLKSLRAEPLLARVTTTSLQALEKYNQALVAAHMQSDLPKAVTLLEEAVALDTGFAAAYRSLGGFLSFMGERERAVAAFDQALRHRDRLTDQERDHTLGIYYQFMTGDLDRAIATYRALLERHPTDSTALGNLAVMYLHIGKPAQAESLLSRMVALDSLHPSKEASLGYLWLATAQVGLGRRQDAERTLATMVHLYGDTSVHAGVVAMLLPSSAGDYRTAEKRALLYKQQHPEIERQESALRQLTALASAQGKISDSERYLRETLAAEAAAQSSVEYLEFSALLGYQDAWLRREPRRAMETIDAALRRFPLSSRKPLDRPYLVLAFGYAAAGDTRRARALLEEYERVVAPIYRRTEEGQRLRTWGAVALAEGRFTDAIRHLQAYAASPRDCRPCGLTALAQAYDRAGQSDSAIALYERYLSTPDLHRLAFRRIGDDDATQLAPALKRLGELYEARGDRVRARAQYARLVELWRDCDPELRPALQEVEVQLRELGG